ncbi:MAG: putative peptide maturation dehydrogenase [Pseudomonadota bacterium]
MKIRRCAVLFLEPREELGIDLAALFGGASTLAVNMRWIAMAPHLDAEVELSDAQLLAVGAIAQSVWSERGDCEERFGRTTIAQLLALGLLLGDAPDAPVMRGRDDKLRAQQWRPLSLLAHTFSRWSGMRAGAGVQFSTYEELLALSGPPPPSTVEYGEQGQAIALPPPLGGHLDATLFARYTGRNFDPQAVLAIDVAARLLQRTFGAQEQREIGPGATALKKLSPSAGGLHPIEAYVLVQRIDGVAPGLYHYHPVAHILEPMTTMDGAQARVLALQFVADQQWFADAPMLVVMAARVVRNFWKYRNHPKAYKAISLDAGHLSQTFYLLAAEAGMPAFVTAAINEGDIERALALDHLADAVLAVCGCGPAAATRTTIELRYGDPGPS